MRIRATSRTVAAAPSPGTAPPAFAPPVRVRVERVESEQDADLGVGTLIDALEAGRSFRLSTGAGQLVATSAVSSLRAVSPSIVEVRTENSVYRLERVDPNTAATTRITPERATQRLAQLRMRKANLATTSSGHTGTVAFASEPGPEAGAFSAGAAIRVTRVRAADSLSAAAGALGAGTLLDDLEVGRPARFCVEGQGAVVTSAVTSMQRIGLRAVQVATRNSSYRFDACDSKREPLGSDSGG